VWCEYYVVPPPPLPHSYSIPQSLFSSRFVFDYDVTTYPYNLYRFNLSPKVCTQFALDKIHEQYFMEAGPVVETQYGQTQYYDIATPSRTLRLGAWAVLKTQASERG
jgi:hypothetical protein